MRKPIIIGNWKMNGGILFTQEFLTTIQQKIQTNLCDVVICPPSTALYKAGTLLKNSSIALGAQNVHFAQKGAYTGELSCDMLKECGVQYVILGHSERRQYFHESNAEISKKLKAVLEAGLIPILCIGESVQVQEFGKTKAYLQTELIECLQGIENPQSLLLAYEPLWAIGTGKTPTAQQANDTAAFVRAIVAQIFSKEVADTMRILYGGSVNLKNANAFLSMPDIDGALIGGVSLIVDEFVQIIENP